MPLIFSSVYIQKKKHKKADTYVIMHPTCCTTIYRFLAADFSEACLCVVYAVQVGTVSAEDFMDDGTPIRLAVTIDRSSRSATFDFGGTVGKTLSYRYAVWGGVGSGGVGVG